MGELELKGIKVLWPQITSRVQVTARGVVAMCQAKEWQVIKKQASPEQLGCRDPWLKNIKNR